eukprot:31732-Chlamydomonas_euryale.AAC.2
MLASGAWKRRTSACRSSALAMLPSMRHMGMNSARTPACAVPRRSGVWGCGAGGVWRCGAGTTCSTWACTARARALACSMPRRSGVWGV